MEQQNNTTKSRKGKHLTREERQQIETLWRAGLAIRITFAFDMLKPWK